MHNQSLPAFQQSSKDQMQKKSAMNTCMQAGHRSHFSHILFNNILFKSGICSQLKCTIVAVFFWCQSYTPPLALQHHLKKSLNASFSGASKGGSHKLTGAALREQQNNIHNIRKNMSDDLCGSIGVISLHRSSRRYEHLRQSSLFLH